MVIRDSLTCEVLTANPPPDTLPTCCLLSLSQGHHHEPFLRQNPKPTEVASGLRVLGVEFERLLEPYDG